ncbi:MAG: YXWGXW repeat-containing protein [Burkholderiales bacterium]
MFSKKILISAMFAAGILGAPVLAPLPAMAAVDVYVNNAPPSPRVERVPGDRRGYAWAPGYWNWQGRRHVWVKGHWVRARPGYAYRPHEWVERDGRWHLNRGRWDRDGDGVPDSRDRHPNNPNRR